MGNVLAFPTLGNHTRVFPPNSPKSPHEGSLLQLRVSSSTGAFRYQRWDFLVIIMTITSAPHGVGGSLGFQLSGSTQLTSIPSAPFPPPLSYHPCQHYPRPFNHVTITCIPSALSSSLSPPPLSYQPCPVTPSVIMPAPSSVS